MNDVLDAASLIEAAQQAAAADDYPEAERLLREAAARQEATLGSQHPDLASTLNNLALVCERTDKLDEAERGYRRAHAIAVASLSPGHPFIATSLGNLVDFCAAHEIPIWKPPDALSGQETSSPAPEAEVPAPEPVPPPEPVLPVYSPASTWSPRSIALTTVGVAVVVAVAFAVQGRGTTDTAAPLAPARSTSSGSDSPATPALTPKPQPTVAPDRRADTAPVERAEKREASTTSASVSVLNAKVCSALEKRGSPDWQCASVSDPQPGTYIFYTRLQTNAETTVEHRWYHGDRVHQVRRLRVTPSPGRGFRTFSSTTISPDRAGDWKVELRADDGTLLREEHFVIR